MSGEGERLTFISRNFWRDKYHVRHTCKFLGKRTLERALLSLIVTRTTLKYWYLCQQRIVLYGIIIIPIKEGDEPMINTYHYITTTDNNPNKQKDNSELQSLITVPKIVYGWSYLRLRI